MFQNSYWESHFCGKNILIHAQLSSRSNEKDVLDVIKKPNFVRMIRLKSNITDKVPPFLRNKYILTVVIFIVWLMLFDSNNLISRFKEMRELKKLKSEKEYYVNRIETDRKKLNELRTDNQNLEKFAREQYKMKKPDEDLYIILTPEEERRINRRNN